MDETPVPVSTAPIQGVVAVILRGERFLVIRRSQFVRAPLMHCFPGGAMEGVESEEDAVRRELMEELSLVGNPVRLLWRSVTPWNVALAWWLAKIEVDAEPRMNLQEVEWCGWLTAEEIRQLPRLLASNVEFFDAWESGEIPRQIE